MLAAAVWLGAFGLPCGGFALAQAPPGPGEVPPRRAERGDPPLPPALPDLPDDSPGETTRPAIEPEAGLPAPAPGVPAVPLRLGDAIRRSLANVQTVQANVAVRTAQVARFDALKEFIPLVTLPQIYVGLNRLAGAPGTNIIFPDVTGGTPLAGLPGMDHVQLSRMFLSFPLDPSGHITALPIAEEGIYVKLLMEQLVRRSQAALAIQRYFEAKQIPYGIRVARRGVGLAQETRLLVGRKLRERQAHDVELQEAQVEEGRARVLLSDLEKNERIAQRQLAVVLHQSRLLVPQQPEPLPIDLDPQYAFDLEDPDEVVLAIVPDFPCSRTEAIQLAKRQRVEVRILITGLRIARLRQKRDWLGLLGKGLLPAELSFKNTTPQNGGVALGAIFGTIYTPPIVDIDLWASIRQARLDLIQSQLDLEKALIDVAGDAGNSWDRWQQATREWEQREKELALRHELWERQVRLYRQHQSFPVEVMGAEVNLLQAEANRWTAWYNLQLARLDVLRATELLLDYVEKAGIAHIPSGREEPEPGFWDRRLAWLRRGKANPRRLGPEEPNQGGPDHETPMVAGVRRDDRPVTGGGPGPGPVPGAPPALAASTAAGPGRVPRDPAAAPAIGATRTRRGGAAVAAPLAAPVAGGGRSRRDRDPAAVADGRVVRAGGSRGLGDAAPGRGGDRADSPGVPVRRAQPGRAAAQRPTRDPAGRPIPGRGDQPARQPTAPGGGDRGQGGTAG